jgi:hypothetical protein
LRRIALRLNGERARSETPGTADGVVQRFQVAENGDRTSEGENLFLHGKSDLYAGQEQFGQVADLSPNIEFLAGDETHGELHKVIPRVREGSELSEKIEEPPDRAEMKTEMEKRIALNARAAALLPGLLEKDEDELGKDDDEYEAYYRADARDKSAQELESGDLEIPVLGDDHPSVAALDAYIAAQDSDRILLPSSCIEAAKIVAGREQGAEVERAPGPGDMIVYTAAPNSVSQWPFHVATAIMTDGDDYVTMENAAPKEDDDATKLGLDRSWYFAMYGSAEEQSFKAAYEADFGFKGTVAVRERKPPQQ